MTGENGYLKMSDSEIYMPIGSFPTSIHSFLRGTPLLQGFPASLLPVQAENFLRLHLSIALPIGHHIEKIEGKSEG